MNWRRCIRIRSNLSQWRVADYLEFDRMRSRPSMIFQPGGAPHTIRQLPYRTCVLSRLVIAPIVVVTTWWTERSCRPATFGACTDT
jgi:hypothetical protein